ncbi:MAG TPA: phosphopantothenoylcysteine decarboxylase, partial [Orrella sp.]
HTPPELVFEMNPDILHDVARLKEAPWCVGFAAETTLDENALMDKRRRKGAALLIANLAQDVMDRDHTTVHLVDDQGVSLLGTGEKTTIARLLIERIAQHYGAHQT